MRIGDLVNDKRCRSPKLGKAGLILSIIGGICWVMWPSSPELPLWVSEDDLELCE